MNFVYQLSMRAGGNIAPNTFVKQDTTADFQALACTANAQPFGVTGTSTRYGAGLPGDDGFIAVAGGNVPVYHVPGTVVQLLAGTGGWAHGNFLASDANGAGVVALTGQHAGALALSSVAAGVKGPVVIVGPGTIAP